MSVQHPLNLSYLKLRARTTRTSVAMALLGELADAARYLAEPVGKFYKLTPGTRGYQALASLRYQKLVRTRKIGDRFEIIITTKGIAQAELERMRQTKKKLPSGHVLLIMFDFPETERTRRNLWRRYLKWFGFIQVQKSVWQIKYDVSTEFAQFVHRVGADAWIQVYIAKKIT